MDDDLVVGVELDMPLRDVAERNQDGARNAIDLILVRLADVDDLERVAAIETLLELDRRNLGGIVHSGRLRCGEEIRQTQAVPEGEPAPGAAAVAGEIRGLVQEEVWQHALG